MKKKDVAVELTLHDIRETPWPFPDRSFDHVIASGVFHLVGHLDHIVSETSRLLRDPGHFCFTTDSPKDISFPPDNAMGGGVVELTNETTGVKSYVQSQACVEHLLRQFGFSVTHTLDAVSQA